MGRANLPTPFAIITIITNFVIPTLMDLLLTTLLFAGAGTIIGWIGAAFIIVSLCIIVISVQPEEEQDEEDY